MNRHRYFLFAIFALCAVIALSKGDPAAKNTPGNDVSVQEVSEMLKKDAAKYYVLDVRTPAEFREGHLPGARNADFWGPTFESDIMKLPKDRPIILYCSTGRRSSGALEELQKEGFENIIHMSQGMEEWQKAKLPLEKAQTGKK